MWRFSTKPNAQVGESQEVWSTDGVQIAPELVDTFVRSLNRGAGLLTEFEFALTVITEVPEGGSIKIVAPAPDYFMNHEELASEYVDDPLSSTPPPVEEKFGEQNFRVLRDAKF